MTVASTRPPVVEEIADVFRGADVEGSLHARPVDGTTEIAIDADRRCVAASTYKVPVLLEVACQAADGRLGPTDRIRVPADRRSTGPTGISTMRDDVELSVRDLATLMIQVSDNTATDVLHELVGTDAVMARLRALGLTATTIEMDCHHLIAAVVDELGPGIGDLTTDQLDERVATSPSIRAERGNTTTARDMTTLLRLIWRDEAGPMEACAEVRQVLGWQHAPHRLSTAYTDGPRISGKTGTLIGGIRNEVGVVDFGEGEAYAVAVFLRQNTSVLRQPDADRAIGTAARLAIDALREGV